MKVRACPQVEARSLVPRNDKAGLAFLKDTVFPGLWLAGDNTRKGQEELLPAEIIN